MVDFVKALERLKVWKAAKAKIGCLCQTDRPRSCYAWSHDVETDEVQFDCQCKCHDSVIGMTIS